MIEGVDGLQDIVEIEIDKAGEVLPVQNDKLIIVDADTLVFGTCTQLEDQDLNGEWFLPLEEALDHFYDKLEAVLEKVGGKYENTELHFTGGPHSFRYGLLADTFPDDETMWYKHKRKKKRKPAGLYEMKLAICSHDRVRYSAIHQKFEADDICVTRKLELGDDAILCCVDKDLWKNTPGRHYNYYSSRKYAIEMKWVETDEDEALYHMHLQMIMGDKSDNILGLPGIGPVKAGKFLELGMNEDELWEGVLTAYHMHCEYGDPEEMAILSAQLVRMDQLYREDDEIKIELWRPENAK